MEYNNLEEALKRAEGNLKHEGMYLTDGERELIIKRAEGKLTQKEFIDKLMELHTKENKGAENINYGINEERIITPKS